MRRGTKITLFIGLGILIAGLVIVLVTLAINRFRIPHITPEEIVAEKISEDIDQGFADISIATVSDKVTVRASEDGKCHLEYTRDSYTDYKVRVEAGVLKIEAKEHDWNWKDWPDFIPELLEEGLSQIESAVKGESHDLILYLPALNFGNVKIVNVSGGISIAGDITADQVNLTTVSGAVSAAELKGVKNLNISGTSGSITVENMVFGNGRINNVSGSVQLNNIDAETMHIELTSGSVNGTIQFAKEFHVDTVSGSVHVPDGGEGLWEIETVSGSVNIELQ